MVNDGFEAKFEALTGFPPFKWQKRLYCEHFAEGQIPSALDIPTGLGKTIGDGDLVSGPEYEG